MAHTITKLPFLLRKVFKNIIFLFLIISFSEIKSQTSYTVSPISGDYACLNYDAAGNGIRATVQGITNNVVTFRVKKSKENLSCNSSNNFGGFSQSGNMKLYEVINSQESLITSVPYSGGINFVEVAHSLPSGFQTGTKRFYLRVYSSNYTYFTGALEITATTVQKPDLVVTDLMLNKSVFYPGEEIKVEKAWVKNTGDAKASKQTKLRYFYSDNLSLGSGDNEIDGTVDNVGGLSENETEKEKTSFDFGPTFTTNGTDYIFAVADANEELDEFDEDNNDKRVGFSIVPVPGSVLSLQSAMKVSPDPTTTGATTTFSFVVENPTLGHWQGDFVLRLLDANENHLDDIRFFYNETIKPKDKISLQAQSASFSQSAGTYHIEVFYDDETVNNWTLLNEGSFENPKEFSVANNAPLIDVSISTSGTYDVGCTADIDWTSSNLNTSNVSIELVKASNLEKVAVIADPTNDDGLFEWEIGKDENGHFAGNIAGGSYKIKMYETGTFGNGFYSNTFSISNPSITITIPNGNANYETGMGIVVDFSVEDVCGNYSAQLVDGNGQVVLTIFNDLPYAPPYSWTIPNLLDAGEYKVKVYKTVAGGPSPVVDFSDATFDIVTSNTHDLRFSGCLPGSRKVVPGGTLKQFSFTVENTGGQPWTGNLTGILYEVADENNVTQIFFENNKTIVEAGGKLTVVVPNTQLPPTLNTGEHRMVVAYAPAPGGGTAYLKEGDCGNVTTFESEMTHFLPVDVTSSIPPTLEHRFCMDAPIAVEQGEQFNATVFIENIGTDVWEGFLTIIADKKTGTYPAKTLFADDLILQPGLPYEFSTTTDGFVNDTLEGPIGDYEIFAVYTNSPEGNGMGDADYVEAGQCNEGTFPSPYSSNTTTIHDFTLNTPGTLAPCDITNPPPSADEIYIATEYLCGEGIIDNPANGDTDPYGTISRGQLAKILFKGLFGSGQTNTLASGFPTPFIDLQDPSAFYYHPAKALSYLEYGDGVEVFEKDFMNFNPDAPIEKRWVAKALLETFNIPVQTNGTGIIANLNPGDEGYDYVYTACQLGILDCSLSSTVAAQRYEAFIMLWRVLTQLSPFTKPVPLNTDFHIPNNLTPKNMGRGLGFADANFNHYTRTSFAIPGIKLPLVFEHVYNSFATELPDQLYMDYERPMGYGWSHSYHCYIQQLVHPTMSEYDRLLVFWPGNNLHSYHLNTLEPETEGIYDELTDNGNIITIKKKNQVVYTFEQIASTSDIWLLISIKDRNNNEVKLQYKNYSGAKKRLDKVVGTAGRALQLHYNHADHPERISSVSDPIDRQVFFNYDADGNLETYDDPAQKRTTYNYGDDDEKHLLYHIELPKGNTITNQYEDRKLQSTTTNNLTITNAYSWSANGASSTVDVPVTNGSLLVKQQQNQLGTAVSASIETTGGTELHSSTMEYNDPDNKTLPTKVTVNNDVVSYLYDLQGNVTDILMPLGVTHQFSYTGLNDVETYTDPKNQTTTFGYDAEGNLVSIVDPLSNTTTIDYWPSGLVKEVENPENITVDYEYDKFGNLEKITAPMDVVVKMDYDLLGRMEEYTDPNGHLTKTFYTVDDLIDKVRNANGDFSEYEYDDNNNLVEIKNANQQTTFLEYDFDYDWLESQSFGGNEDEFDYYPDGRLHTHTDPNQHTDTYLYDSQGRLIDDGYATYEYYPAPDNELHKVKRKSDPSKVVTFTYDALNRVKTVADYYGNTITYDYDNNSNLTEIEYPDGKKVTYEYDAANRLEKVIDWNNKETIYEYLKDGRLDKTTLPNGIFTEYYYDDAGRMEGMGNFRSLTDTINYYEYVLDPAGNHLQVEQKEPFGYFAWTAGDTVGTYDDFNHIQSFGDLNYGDDDNGNIMSISGGAAYTFSWDTEDQLTGITGGLAATYEYDALGHRRKAIRNGTTTRFVLDILGMSKVLMETDDNNNPLHYYVHGLGLIARIDVAGNYHYYHYDYRGSTIAMTDDAKNITHQYQYGPYGETLRATEADLNRYRYVGAFGVQYENNDIYFMRARYYDVRSKRFISEDPVWGENLYGYVDGNPIIGFDPTGDVNWRRVGKGLLLVGVATAAIITAIPSGGTSVVGALALFGTINAGAYGVVTVGVGLLESPEHKEDIDKVDKIALTLTNPLSLAGGGVGAAIGSAYGSPEQGFWIGSDVSSVTQGTYAMGSALGNMTKNGIGVLNSIEYAGGASEIIEKISSSSNKGGNSGSGVIPWNLIEGQGDIAPMPEMPSFIVNYCIDF